MNRLFRIVRGMWRDLLFFRKRFQRNVRRVKALWPVTPDDCRGQLIFELFFDEGRLVHRYREEIEFQHNLKNGWIRKR